MLFFSYLIRLFEAELCGQIYDFIMFRRYDSENVNYLQRADSRLHWMKAPNTRLRSEEEIYLK